MGNEKEAKPKANKWRITGAKTRDELDVCCPVCGVDGKLEKRKDTGIAVKHCRKCNRGWFILQTSGD